MNRPARNDLSARIEAAALLAAPALILITPLVTFLRHHGYDLLAHEVILCIAALSVVGLVIGVLSAIRPLVVGPIVLFAMTIPWIVEPAATVILSAAEAFLGPNEARSSGPSLATRLSYGAIGLVGLVLFALFWMLRRHVGVVASVAFSVMLVVAAFSTNGRPMKSAVTIADPQPLRADLPPVVHLVLDEHIGIAGIPEDIDGAGELKRDITAFYERYGFRLYPNAFSHYWNTEDSLANLLNGTLSPLMHA